jgi:formylglycine-generating enzyme required for sulfatase activity
MGRLEVTQEQYQQVMGTNPSNFKGTDLPVEMVSWDDAQQFCSKASAKGIATLRLPSEAEWEYACRAGTRTSYHSGDSEADFARAAWYGSKSNSTIHLVGQKEPNAFGLYDMHGNVWEWCEDDSQEDYAGAPTDGTAWVNAPRGSSRVFRGGAFRDIPRNSRSAYRLWANPDNRNADFGFRVVLVSSRTP